ncbi:MAG: hypothetical protein ACOYMA_01215 [Bacteroidia bacterium]
MNEKINPYKTTLTIVSALLIIYWYNHIALFLYVAMVIGLAGIISSYLNNKIAFYWMKLAEMFGLIFPKIMLTILYFFVLTPLALLSKLGRKKNFLQLKNTQDSLFLNVKKTFPKQDFEKMW